MSNAIYRLDSHGNIIHTYSISGAGGLIDGVALDPSGTSFWAADYFNSQVDEISLSNGTVERMIGGLGDRAAGVAVFDAPSAPEPGSLSLVLAAALLIGARLLKRS